MNENITALLAAAVERDGSTLPDTVLARIERMEGGDLGPDWTDYIPAEVADRWEVLAVESRLVAFLAAADRCRAHSAQNHDLTS